MVVLFPAAEAKIGNVMSVRFAMIAQVRAYWEALRKDGELPLRAQIDPRGIEGALAHSFLVERIAPGMARFRLAGMHLNDLMGMDVRGMPLGSIFEPPSRDAIVPKIEQVFSTPSILDLSLEGNRGIGQPALSGRMILLPVRSDQGTDLALGCIATEGLIGRSPRRFVCGRALHERILGHGAPHPAGFAEDAAPFTPARPVGKPHLRIVRPDE